MMTKQRLNKGAGYYVITIFGTYVKTCNSELSQIYDKFTPNKCEQSRFTYNLCKLTLVRMFKITAYLPHIQTNNTGKNMQP